MLQSLYIRNYALIDELRIRFESGFSVITGETGAGKSIILGAIGLLLGQRADVKAIKTDASKCVVEASFAIGGYDLEDFFARNDLDFEPDACLLRREVAATGKSRAFINDTPVSLTLIKELGEKLIDIHSQHQNLLLNKEGFQLNILDIVANNDTLLPSYRQAYNAYRKSLKQFDTLQNEAEQRQKEEDYIRFQFEQLDEANLKPNEKQLLEQEAETLSHAEEIKATLFKTSALLNGDEHETVLNLLRETTSQLQGLERVFSPASEWNDRLKSCYIELKDLALEFEHAQEEVEFNPERLDFVNQRLNLIYSLEQKHQVSSVEELIEQRENYRSQIEAIDSFDERLQHLQKQIDKEFTQTMQLAANLSEKRKTAAQEVSRQLQQRLIPLGMPNVRFEVELTARNQLDENGIDTVNFLFSANKNGQLQQVANIASGGEIARVMLSLKALIAGAVKLPTIIFDEIDTGVSGSIAEKMADIMQEMGQHNRQVISITHLPQIAAKGKIHYKVYKKDTDTDTVSHIRQLTFDERVEELAGMLSGATRTEAAIHNAKALLKQNEENL